MFKANTPQGVNWLTGWAFVQSQPFPQIYKMCFIGKAMEDFHYNIC